jgi:hypothetical protein
LDKKIEKRELTPMHLPFPSNISVVYGCRGKGGSQVEQIAILAKNETGGDPFRVLFILDNGKLKITCNCPEGRKNEICQHKVRLASNDLLMLDNPSQRGRLFEAHVWVIQSRVSDPLLKLLQIEGEEEKDSESIIKLQREINTLMKEGS